MVVWVYIYLLQKKTNVKIYLIISFSFIENSEKKSSKENLKDAGTKIIKEDTENVDQQPIDQHHYTTNQQLLLSNHAVDPNIQIVEPADQSNQPADQLEEPTNQIVKPNQIKEQSDQLVEPIDQLVESVDQPSQRKLKIF